MSASEQQRHQLFSWFEEMMGPERAATMMDLLPPVGWADVATKPDLVLLRRDVVELERRIDLRFDALDHRFDALEHKVTSALHSEIATSTRTFVTWMIAVGGVVLTSIGAATGLLIALG